MMKRSTKTLPEPPTNKRLTDRPSYPKTKSGREERSRGDVEWIVGRSSSNRTESHDRSVSAAGDF